LNPDFVLNCVLRQHVWSSEAWLSKHGWSYTCKECCWRTSTEKNTCGIARFPCGSTAFLYLDVFDDIKEHIITNVDMKLSCK